MEQLAPVPSTINTEVKDQHIGLGVIQAVLAVKKQIAEIGIAKRGTNDKQKYRYRTLDDIYQKVCSLSAEHGLICIPSAESFTYSNYPTQNGGLMHMHTVTMSYHFAAQSDGSCFTARIFGSASDAGDKSMSKAVASAHKSMLNQIFEIPVSGLLDNNQSQSQPRNPNNNQQRQSYNSQRETESKRPQVNQNGVSRDQIQALKQLIISIGQNPVNFFKKRNLGTGTLTLEMIEKLTCDIEKYIDSMTSSHKNRN